MNQWEKQKQEEALAFKKMVKYGSVIAGLGLAAVGIASRVKIARASQYVVRTGILIEDISVTKKAIQLPFQQCSMMSIEPVTLEIEVDAMSMQRIPFRMPSVWTIGPKNDAKHLENYARLLMDKGPKGVEETIEGVIQGETRVLTANLDLNKLFSDRDDFKHEVVGKINHVMEPFGLTIYNANIAELKDLDKDNQFFSEQKRRALQKVNQEARVNVAEAVKDGEVGEKNFKSQARQGVAHAERDAKLVEFDREREISESKKDLEVAQAQYKKETSLAQIQADAEAEERRWQLQMAVEEKRMSQQVEYRRAEFLAATQVEAERVIARAEGAAKAVKIQAEADLYAKQQEATGIQAIREAEAEGLSRLIHSAGNVDGLNRYLMIRDNLLPELAEKQAQALQGLKPRVNVWKTGPSDNQSPLSDTLTDLFHTGMPLFEGIKDQTGYDFLGRLGLKSQSEETPLQDSEITESDTK